MFSGPVGTVAEAGLERESAKTMEGELFTTLSEFTSSQLLAGVDWEAPLLVGVFCDVPPLAGVFWEVPLTGVVWEVPLFT